MQIAIKLILTVIIVGIQLAGFICMAKIWRSDIDIIKMLSKPFSFIEYKKSLPPPIPKFQFLNFPTNYKPGLEVHDVIWQEDYIFTRFQIKNESDKNKMEDIRIEFEIPGGFVTKKVKNQIGAEGVTFSEDKLPMGIGNKLVMNQTVHWYSNRLNLGIAGLKEKSNVEIDFVMKRMPSTNGGHFSISYSFQEDAETKKTERHTYPIRELTPNGELKIDTDNEIKGQYTASIKMIPASPLLFKKDGSVEIKK